MEKHPTERCRNGFYGAPQEQGFRRQIRHVEFGKRMEISGRKLWVFLPAYWTTARWGWVLMEFCLQILALATTVSSWNGIRETWQVYIEETSDTGLAANFEGCSVQIPGFRVSPWWEGCLDHKIADANWWTLECWHLLICVDISHTSWMHHNASVYSKWA